MHRARWDRLYGTVLDQVGRHFPLVFWSSLVNSKQGISLVIFLFLCHGFLWVRQGPCSGGRGCLGEGRLGVPGQVWKFRFLPASPSFPREKSQFKKCLGERLEVPDILLPDIRGLRTCHRDRKSLVS